MKLKQLLALLLALAMVLAIASCDNTPDESGTSESTSETTTESTTTESTLLQTQQTTAAPIPTIPIEEAANAVKVAADPVTETKEIPLIVILANFDADGDGENDWDPDNPKKLTDDKTQPYYGEQWAGSEVTDHYDRYFGDGYSLTNYYDELSMGAFRFVPIEFDVVPEGSPYDNGIIEVTVNLPHPSALGKIINNSEAAQKCITAVFEATDPYVDYTKYDLNGNGRIDATELGVIILNPGQDASNGTTSLGGRHPFQVHGTSQGLTANCDGLTFYKVSNFGEYGKNGGIMNVGTPIHELAHNLGAEDLYDTNRNGHGGSTVTGWPRAYNFSLECNGNHISNGQLPSYLDPYHRIYLGWADYEVVEDGEEGVYTLYSTVTGKYKVLRINTPDPGEYYLVEVRTDEGFEKGLAAKANGGGIMIWHIDEDLCDRYFVEGSASTSTALNGVRHDPAIVPLFRVGYDENGQYMSNTSPSDPYYYYDPANPDYAVFDSANFRSVTNGTISLNSYPEDWEGAENYNLHIEILSEPGSEMTIKVTSGRKNVEPSLELQTSDSTQNSLTVSATVKQSTPIDITAAAILLSTKEDFSENRITKEVVFTEDMNATITFDGLTPETQYFYKLYFVYEFEGSDEGGYLEEDKSSRTLMPPKEKTECKVALYSDPDARSYDVEGVYGKKLEIPSGWLKSIQNKHRDMTLEGWYYDAEFTKPFDMDAPIEKDTEDFSLYAKWVPNA